jgi:hypothetical protein
MKEEQIFFKLRIDIPDLDKHEPDAQKSALEYVAELVFETNTDCYIKIFFDLKERLDGKVMSWEPHHAYTLLSKFIVTGIIAPDHLKHIDFCHYEYKGMASEKLDEFGKLHFTVRLKGIRLVYEAAEQRDSEIYLNHTSFPLIELNYRYTQFFSWSKEKFQFEPLNNIKEFIPFNKIEFKPEHNFYVSTKSTDKLVHVTKEPRLKIQHENLTAAEVQIHTEMLCSLYSFYSNKKIDWEYSRIYAEGKLFIEFRDTVQEENKFPHGIFIWDFIQNPLNLVRNVNAGHVVENSEIVSRLVERYTYALNANDEIKFLILYSVLEELRNYYILAGQIEKERAGIPPNLNRVKDEYRFTRSANKTYDFIKDSLKQISEIVVPEEKEQFENEVSFKVNSIKIMSMTDQFRSYFAYVGIDPQRYDLDFKELKSLRDNIFHGRPIKDREYLKKVNWYERLPRLTGELLIKFFGIEDLKKIEKKRVWE